MNIKKRCYLLMLVVSIFISVSALQVRAEGPAPPPPGHSLNGNQVSPGGTGCPIDRSLGIIGVLACSLAFAGVILYNRSKGNATSNTSDNA